MIKNSERFIVSINFVWTKKDKMNMILKREPQKVKAKRPKFLNLNTVRYNQSHKELERKKDQKDL